MKAKGTKVFKTINEQIAILQSRGLVIDDISFAEDILIRENYFFLNGYRHLFMKSPKENNYITGSNFRELYGLFVFDRHIRNIFFKNLLIIENNMKSIFSYQLSKKYGYMEKDYLRADNFANEPGKQRQINDLIRKMKRQISINGAKHTATSHYLTNYGYIPLWIGVKVLSFGIVGELYSIMKKEDRDEIAEIYHIDSDTLYMYLPILSNYRNLCAHEDILFDHRNQKIIDDTKYHDAMQIPITDGEYIYGKDDLFAIIIILKRLLRDDEFRLMINEISYEIDLLSGKLHTITINKVLDKMGFPVNYREIINL